MPQEFMGDVIGDLNARRGRIEAIETNADVSSVRAVLPLAETFGYSTDLRSMTQGQGTFTMEFARYKRLPKTLEEELIAERKKMAMAGAV